MSERYSVNSSEAVRTFSFKKNRIVAHLERQLRDKSAKYDSVEGATEAQREHHRSNPPLDRIPKEAFRDGGSDISEWRAQVGHDRQERSGDGDDSHELEYLARNISALESDLEFVTHLTDYPRALDELDGDSDAKLFDRLFEEAAKATEES